MENWCYDKKVLRGIRKHHETGEPLADDLYDKLVASKNFGSGTRYLGSATSPWRTSSCTRGTRPGEGDVFAVERAVAENSHHARHRRGQIPLRLRTHLRGGYPRYSYLWAEVLSADAFGAFEEAGLEDDDAVKTEGTKFANTVLSLGGGVAPLEVFKSFRGREPSVEALLRHNGLVAASA